MIKKVSKGLSLLMAISVVLGVSACKDNSIPSETSLGESSVSVDVIETGDFTGSIMYSNKTSGTPAYEETDALVQLISLELKEFPPEYYYFSEKEYEEYGIYATTTDSAGDFEFFGIPVGEYRMIVRSNNAEWGTKQQIEYINEPLTLINRIYGDYLDDFAAKLFEEKGDVLMLASSYMMGCDITIKANREIKKNVTCINWRSIL